MQKSTSIYCIFQFLLISLIAQQRSDTIYFKSGSSELSELSIQKIETIQSNTIYLEGRTDSEGETTYNLELSKQRVLEVKKALLKNGINEKDIKSEFIGESNNEAETWKNRCVIVQYKDIKNTPKLSELRRNESSNFTFRNNEGLAIRLDNDVLINIEANSFQARETDKIELRVTSYMDKVDFILADLHSKAGDSLLESAGMFKIEAIVNSKPNKLKQGKTIDIKIPNKTNKNDFQLFEGQIDPHQTNIHNNIDWVVNVISDTKFIEYGSFKIDGEKKEYFINYSPIRRHHSYHKSKHFKIPQSQIESALQKQLTPVKFDIKLKITNGKIESQTIEVLEGTLVKGISNKLFRVLKKSEWRKKKDSHTIVLKFNYGRTIQIQSYSQPINVANINIDSAALDLVLLKVTKLGWINCDRFYQSKNKEDISISTDKEASVKIIFSNFNGIINGNLVGNTFQFGQIPIDEPFHVLAFKEVENEVLIAQLSNENYNSELVYHKIFREDFIKILETL
jgi:hypothetical protein